MAEESKLKHWPVIALIGLFTVVLLISMMLFQVKTTEVAVVKRFGKPVRTVEAGLHVKWPWPVEDVWHPDNRIHIFEGTTGKFQELFTADQTNVIVTVYIGWKINTKNAQIYMEKLTTQERAEEYLTSLMKTYEHSVIGNYSFSQLVNIEPSKVMLTEIEEAMQKEVSSRAANFGIDIRFLGIKYIGLPESASQAVFARMKAERERISQKFKAEGEAEANKIKAQADYERNTIIAQAEQKAKDIRAGGDAKAAESYDVFAANPELAVFLRQLESLKKTLASETTLVFDTNTEPFTLFRSDAMSKVQKGTIPTTGKPAAGQQ